MRKALPAILGGAQAVTGDSQAANRWPAFGPEEEAAVLEVLRHGDLSCHPVTRRLEDDFRERFGVRHALAHCNGTSALLAAFFALDLKPGDEVLVPSATFWASVLPMLWVGALPVFCESEPQRLGLDPTDVERRITPRTRALVVVHLFGMPSRMTELLRIARKHNLAVIEDASHALGAVWRDRPCGALGDVAVFSLQNSKLAPAGEGGMFLTNDDDIMERAVCLGDIVRIAELDTPARRFAATGFGFKTRMAALSAAVARVQLQRADNHNDARNRNVEYLSERLERLGFDTFLPPEHVDRVYFELVIRRRTGAHRLKLDALVTALEAEGCEVSRPRYPLLHQQPFFTERQFHQVARVTTDPRPSQPNYRVDDLPRTADLSNELLRLPHFTFAKRQLLDEYVGAFEKAISSDRELSEMGEA